MKLSQREKTLTAAALKADMDEKTARKYLRSGRLPSEMKVEHTWRTRQDPFAEVWDWVRAQLQVNEGLEAKTLFQELQRRYPGRFQDGQLRTLQRRVKIWRATEGPAKEIFFPQLHRPGELAQSDFTDMKTLGVTIQRQPFDHLVYHFVLTYSNWETATICFSESFESLSEGLQNALWELGGVPRTHQTDCLTSAVQKLDHPDDFTQRYEGLLNHYGLEGRRTQPASPHENGDIEQRHHRYRKAVDQALMLRGSRDFESRMIYAAFLRNVQSQLNAGRTDRLAEELKVLRRLPTGRLDACRRLEVRVSSSSTIRVLHNTYSVHSRLKGEKVQVRVYAEYLDVFYAQRRVERLPRLRGKQRHLIQYPHIIEWLVRKPGAFADYRYRADLYPTSRFRRACDLLEEQHARSRAHRIYLDILELAAAEGEAKVDQALEDLLGTGTTLSKEAVHARLRQNRPDDTRHNVEVGPVHLAAYDELLDSSEPSGPVTPALARDFLQEAAG
jgi:transposase|tara:strand:- start:837 stop:2339 length:1503 start_codon:yes stop_codon:yes gene_type:complete